MNEPESINKMGTRSLTVFYDFDSKQETCVLYRQYDGDPSGHGKDLADTLQPFHMVNGLNGADYGNPESFAANGLACLTARVIALFKKSPGMFYLYPGGARDMSEEYLYFVTVRKETEIFISAYDDNLTELFTGNVTEFSQWTAAQA